jgi:FixJ family two-component response regulator
MPETPTMTRAALTKRERQIVARVARGRTNREIAHGSEHRGTDGQKPSVGHLREDARCANRLELALLAVQRGLDRGLDE